MNASPLTTTDATTTTLQSYSPQRSPTGPALMAFDLLVTAQADDGTSAVFFIRGAGKSVSGSVSVVGTTSVTSIKDAGASTWTATLDASGGAIRLRVTGASSTTILWRVEKQDGSSGLRGGVDWAA